MQELKRKQAMEECGYCKERESRMKNYEDEIEKEKIVQCQMALEREKIAKGMQCTKADEVRHKEMLKMQMQEKKLIEEEKERVEMMWHELLLDTVRMKEQYERQETIRLNQEMIERRHFYNEQISSANKKRREVINHERDIENRRLQRMKKKMEEDYFEEIKRKKEQQLRNRINFIQGHEDKLMHLRNAKNRDRELDNRTIRNALEEIKREKQQIRNKMQIQRIHEQIFVDNFNREKEIAEKLEQETNHIITEWEHQKEKAIEENIISAELEKAENKKNAAQEYRRHIDERRREMEKDRLERFERMERVKKTAFAELRRNLDNANEELRRQIEHRNNLTSQIKENQRVLESELNSVESKQRPFTKKAIMFKEAMADKDNVSRASTNPVHPFRRFLQTHPAPINSKFTLPCIHK